MRVVRDRVERAAQSDCAVLLTGETGTGKGEIARVIHELSRRSKARRVHVDCAALAPSVIESELFGHERGAFTDAASRRAGRFERAEGGTLFLDEIGELAPGLQAKLLRVLHDRSFERVGGDAPLDTDVRIVAATNRSLAEEVAIGRFRSDLYYRLAVVEIELPPLRARLEDLPQLCECIAEVLSHRLERPPCAPTPGALAVLKSHAWPGNIRELANLLERVAVCWPGRAFDRAVALGALRKPGARLPAPLAPRAPCAREADRLARALAGSRGNVSRAARELGIPRSTLRYRLARAGGQGKGADPGPSGSLGPSSRQLYLPF